MRIDKRAPSDVDIKRAGAGGADDGVVFLTVLHFDVQEGLIGILDGDGLTGGVEDVLEI